MGRIEKIRVEIPYYPRRQFEDFHNRSQRWAVIVAHRRAGKTVACINDLVKQALTCKKPEARFAYLAPFHAQAKDVAWDYLLRYTAPIPGREANISEMRVDLPGGARIRLYGAENAERMRGLYLDGIVIDEPADIDPRVWPEIIRPALADRQGWAVWIGTPKGKNSFWQLWDRARNDDSWFKLNLRASQTQLVDANELAEARKEMSEDQYEQEFECSFDAAIQGAYYGKLMREAEEDERICHVGWEPSLPVYTAWDLGIGDSTAIWFAQLSGMECRLIDYYKASGVALDHYAKLVRDKPYTYAEHILPHDVMVSDLSTGKTRFQTLASLGINGRVLNRDSIDDGIHAVRRLLPNCWFDAKKCAHGIEALKQYRVEYDEKRKTFKDRPLHDWASDPADAFRYLARGLPELRLSRERQRYSGHASRNDGEAAWMGI